MIQGKSCQCRCYELVYIGKRPKYPHIFAPQSYNRIISLLNNTLHTIVVLRDSSNRGEGAKIAIGSWGRNYQSRYSPDCQDVDAALSLHSDVLYVASSGNDGDSGSGPWRTVKNPADCKNTLAVGASQSYGTSIKQNDLGPNYMASFSARGPTADGRTKPDLVHRDTRSIARSVIRAAPPIAPLPSGPVPVWLPQLSLGQQRS